REIAPFRQLPWIGLDGQIQTAVGRRRHLRQRDAVGRRGGGRERDGQRFGAREPADDERQVAQRLRRAEQVQLPRLRGILRAAVGRVDRNRKSRRERA